MKKTILNAWIISAALALAWSATEIHAQESQPATNPAQTAAPEGQPGQPSQAGPQLKINPLKTLQNLEPAADAEYEIGAGDVISLDFPNRPELSGQKKVGPDGRITLNMAGSIDVANKTRSQAAQAILAALAPYYTGLTVTVDVDSYGSNRVIVLGNVQHPGVLYFDDTPTLLDVIARAGLMANTTGAPTGNGPTAVSARDGIPDRCAIYRGNDQVVWVDLKSMLQNGNALADMRLKRNDIVFIPSQQEIFVSVLGAVQHPGAVPLTPQSTLVSVIAESGGVAEGASLNHIQIAQAATGKTITVSYKKLVSLKNNEVQLHAGDVIFIPQSGFYKSTYVLQRVSPIATIGSIAAVAAY